MARPRTDTRDFRRKITPAQRAILLHAGQGDITVGFNECLELWRAIHPIVTTVSRETQSTKYPGKYPGKAPSTPSPTVSPMKQK